MDVNNNQIIVDAGSPFVSSSVEGLERLEESVIPHVVFITMTLLAIWAMVPLTKIVKRVFIRYLTSD